MTAAARLIGLDWGTSSLRAYLLGDGGAVIEDVTLPWGIMATPERDFAKALETATGAWRRSHPGIPMIASGMIGSAQGWREIPYISCPGGMGELVAALKRQPAETKGVLPIVPGIALDGEFPGVMRGEETQIVGALDLVPGLFGNSLLVLPGTHSKWVEIRDGRIVTFTTYLTGELFAVLAKHSILGRPALDAGKAGDGPQGPAAAEAFDRGVRTIRDNPSRGLSPLLFTARTLVLSHRLAPEFSLDYLSGLLIGEELRCALAEWQRTEDASLALIGTSALCERYARALALFGIAKVPIIGGASAAGLWRIAEQASFHPRPFEAPSEPRS